MKIQIRITTEQPSGFKGVLNLYETLGWNSFDMKEDDFRKMCTQSWFVVYAYDQSRLVGMGRIISDGVISAIICGLGVAPTHQQLGIGKQLMEQLIEKCLTSGINPQLMCVESLEPYYESLGFRKFAIGMAWDPSGK
ncbi:GNAT family N-acetyltransferase [Planomicrobium sp. CPCC 101110]|uniref:GNAT family N-acetyltransferase n=1 Tax=Planomicrobium sp. CPCC 101110 TaxID=2599619 RepID=UPI0011B5994D|nr:GNAT family N-acetyltransferase [Planomicrobium sp. CPCC 101110]TWT25940.1 GNAT family N-acetyltransferase [Planomicrobium sp. CPCC 101110]